MLKPWASVFTLHCSNSLSCLNEYLPIDSGGYVQEQPSHINCSIWLDASQRSRDGIWVNRSVREVKCKALWAVLRTGYCVIYELPLLLLRNTYTLLQYGVFTFTMCFVVTVYAIASVSAFSRHAPSSARAWIALTCSEFFKQTHNHVCYQRLKEGHSFLI